MDIPDHGRGSGRLLWPPPPLCAGQNCIGREQRVKTKRLLISIAAAMVAVSVLVTGCAQSSPAPIPTKVPAAVPTKAAEPTKTSAAPAAAQPTAALAARKVDWPEKGKTITIIVPFGAGAADSQARIMAAFLEEELGIPVQVVNKPGAASQTGLTELAKSKPDGYTVGLTPLPTAYNTYLDPERKAAYGRKDLVQVANQVVDPEAIGVRADSPYKTLKDLLDAAKARPGELKAATAGLLGNDHLGILLIGQTAGVKLNPVHFDGGGAAVTALLGGHVDLGVHTIGAFAPSAKGKKARLLAVMDRERSKFFPDVPTMDELGYKGQMGSYRGFSVPAGTPKEIVDILSAAIRKGSETEGVKKKMDEMMLPQRYMDAAEYTRYWDEFEAQAKPLLEIARKEQK